MRENLPKENLPKPNLPNLKDNLSKIILQNVPESIFGKLSFRKCLRQNRPRLDF